MPRMAQEVIQKCGMMPRMAQEIDNLSKAAFSHSYAQVRERTMQLQSLVSANKFFRNTHKPNQEGKVRAALAEVRTQVEKVANIWKSLLAPQCFARFLGAILDNVCTYIYAEIMSLKDISVRETEVLPTLILELMGEGLAPFLSRGSPGQPKGGPSAADEEEDASKQVFEPLFSKFAPNWTKLRELVDLFSMRLQQIVDRWEDGHWRAKGFTSDEVIHFISLVFEDGDYRTEKINRILQQA